MLVTSSKSSGKRNRITSSFLRLFVLSLLTATFASSAAFAQQSTPITQCSTVISQPGFYTVANDLSCFFEDGIDIVADHVTLMLNNHQIAADFFDFGFFGNGISVGVGVPSGNSHVRILGPGTITGFNAGINFEQVSHSSVQDVTSTSNFFGFVVNGGFTAGCNQSCPSTKNVFQGNTSTFNDQHGFTMNGANDNSFRDNNASNNGANGLLLFTASGNDVNGNTATGNGDSGIAVSSDTGTNNTIKNNTAQNNTNFDLNDGNPNCDSNSWKNNIFGSSNQACIQ
jgi:parallel beta-helix repeat protein